MRENIVPRRRMHGASRRSLPGAAAVLKDVPWFAGRGAARAWPRPGVPDVDKTLRGSNAHSRCADCT